MNLIILVKILLIFVISASGYVENDETFIEYNDFTYNPKPTLEEYMEMRHKLVKQQNNENFESDITLNERELLANEIIMALKRDEIESGLANPSNFTPSRHLFEVRDKIAKSKLFQLIRLMPKGGVLHAHATSMCSPDFMVNITYRDHLWQCNHTINGIVRFKFAINRPVIRSGCVWYRTVDERKRIGAGQYDAYVRTLFTLYKKNYREIYRDINEIWYKFDHILDITRSLVTYVGVWKDYYKEALRQYASDNVQYLEFRGGSLNQVYDLYGNIYSPVAAIQMYIDVLEEYKKENPDFIGSRFIYCPFRLVSNEKITTYIKTIRLLDKLFPNFFAGYDFAGQEDRGRRLIDFVPYVLQLPPHINAYFHAGETNWFGETDENLIDAILLGTKRIGHGYALAKHPILLELIKRQHIVVEVNPISNQVLTLVDDQRNHPGAVFLAAGIPIIISSDNYPLWEATPMSTDYYLAFLGIASSRSDLRTLKKLVQNTIIYSSLNDNEKQLAFNRWLQKWNQFIEIVIAGNY